MKNSFRKPQGGQETSGGEASTSVEDRRATPRQQFVAEAQIVEIRSGVRLSARSCDLVLHGCYVDTLRPFPVGTLVRIRLKKDGTAIEANGNVVYELPGLGMGIAFHDLTPDSHAAIEKWLSHTGGREDSLEALLPPLDAEPPPAPREQARTEFQELVWVLIRKGILTKSEAARFLKEAVEE
jgi:hypothetical protein